MKSNFVDYVKIYFRSGKGGDGCVSWRREKYVPFGGPDGGDGGRGGHIILRGNKQLWTLLDLKYRKHIHAANGIQGSGNRMKGADAENTYLDVPLGTVAYNADTNEYLGEIMDEGQEIVLLRGGDGGLGNWHFRTSTNQAPEYAQKGRPATEMAVVLELKVLADVGLVGLPNAGKSTLLAATTKAKPAIADYPFTTLVPNLGIVPYRDYRSFVMADIPGIIEGAHEGRGLGVQFLRHIERNAVLLFLVPVTTEDIGAEYRLLCNELEQYDPDLAYKLRLLVITKLDLLDDDTLPHLKTIPAEVPTVQISAATGHGLDELKDRLWTLIEQERANDTAMERGTSWHEPGNQSA
jgi:GTP-binding protein